MVAADRVVWRRQPPRRAAGRLGCLGLVATVVLATAWLLFGHEPGRIESGSVNPLSRVVPVLVGCFALLVAVRLVTVLRLPYVAADSFALTVRPGAGRTLVLPWATITELATVNLGPRSLMLVRCGHIMRAGDRPSWSDRSVLRAATRISPTRQRPGRRLTSYDLAVFLDDFTGTPGALLASLTPFVPPHVALVDLGVSLRDSLN